MAQIRNLFNRNTDENTNNQEEKKMKKEEKKAARQAKKNQKKYEAELARQEQEEAYELRMQAMHRSSTETEALFHAMGKQQFSFFMWALVLLVACAGLYFLIQSIILSLALFFSILSWLGITR